MNSPLPAKVSFAGLAIRRHVRKCPNITKCAVYAHVACRVPQVKLLFESKKVYGEESSNLCYTVHSLLSNEMPFS